MLTELSTKSDDTAQAETAATCSRLLPMEQRLQSDARLVIPKGTLEKLTRFGQLLYLMPLLCGVLQAGPLKPVTPPDFIIPEVGYYASWVYPNAGWAMMRSNPLDSNSNPAAGADGAMVKRAGMYSASGQNIVEAWCAPNYYWINQGTGVHPFGWTYQDVVTKPTNGDCIFNATIGSSLRYPIPGVPIPPLPPQTTPYPKPSSNVPYAFDVKKFATNVKTFLNLGLPAPVGYELAIRDPQGQLVYSIALGSVTGSSGLPPELMTTERRIDTASMSKTITATAVMAAFEDLASHTPPLNVTLDSSILPFLPSTWHPKTTVANVTFRSLLRHTSGFCSPGAPAGDKYAEVQAMVEFGPATSWVGTWHYCDSGYALLRVILPYLIDGPQSYKPFEATPALNDQITAESYRHYVRNRIFDPIGLSGVDEFYTGPLPETIYFDKNKKAIPDNLNIPGYIPGAGYNQTANNMVLTAGSGSWTMSANEYSLFISSLWRGKIVSHDSVTTMLAQVDPNAPGVGIGMYGSQVLYDGKTWSDFNEDGGGYLGGAQGIWMTFFNGYTVVFLSNTAWGCQPTTVCRAPYQVLEDSLLPALSPVAKPWPM